jgi:hypothetical protein
MLEPERPAPGDVIVRRLLASGLLAVIWITPGCAGSTGSSDAAVGGSSGFSDAAIDEWLSVCMEGPPYEAYCRCYASAVSPLTSEDDFLSHMREPLIYLSREALETAERECSGLEPILRTNGIAAVVFGTPTDEALADLEGMFGEALTSPSPECEGATVASWGSIQATFTEAGFAGWAYGAAEPDGRPNPPGLHAELSIGTRTVFVYTSNSFVLLQDQFDQSSRVSEGTLIISDAEGRELRAAAVGDSAVRFEAGTVCDS